MNFKKYHVSRNLWDEEYPNISPTIKYVPLYVGEGSFTLSSTTPLPPNGAACLFFFSGSVDSGAGPQNRVYHENPRTVDSIDGYVTIAYRITSYDPRDYTTMLNTGSTPLPYEPYSSEVWHDIPHYIHKTDTDTITTLPADIFPNATTATVGLKGNMYQASGVSPTTPIQPQETGERTEQLYDDLRTETSTWQLRTDKYIIGCYGNSKSIASINIESYSIGEHEITVKSRASGCGIGVIVEIESNKTYTLSFDANVEIQNASYIGFNLISADGVLGTYESPLDTKVYTFNSGSAKYAYIVFRVNPQYGEVTYSNIMLNTGSTALPYEPYGYKLDISSGDTTTPVYLGEVQTERFRSWC